MSENKDKKIDINALGQVMDTSWTRSGASHGSTVTTHSVKAQFVDESKIKISYMTVVNMVRDKEMRDLCNMYEKEADSIIESVIKKIAVEYKEIAEDSIKFKRTKIDSNVEIVDLNHFNQKRSAIFRRIAFFEIV
jgi:hypothetical protein